MRVLGPQKFGLLAVATAFTQYLVIFTDYGFNFTATRKIAIYRNDNSRLSEIFNTVLVTKFILMGVSLIVAGAAVLLIPQFRLEWSVFLGSFLAVIGNVIFPAWFFQGMERMKYITLLNLIAKSITTIAIFIFVRKHSDYLKAMIIQSSDVLLAGLMSLVVIRRSFSLRISLANNRKSILNEIKEGGKIFTASLAGNVYGQGAVIVCGLVAGQASAGYYSIGQKITMILGGLVHPVAQSLYPYLCLNAVNDKHKFADIKKKAFTFMTIVSLLTGFFLFLNANLVARLVTGSVNSDLITIIKIFAFIMILQQLNVLIYAFIMALKQFDAIQRVLVMASILFLITSFPATYFWGVKGMTYTILFVVELYVFLNSLYILQSHEIPSQ